MVKLLNALEPNAIVDSISPLAARAGQPRQSNNTKKIVTLVVPKPQHPSTVSTLV